MAPDCDVSLGRNWAESDPEPIVVVLPVGKQRWRCSVRGGKDRVRGTGETSGGAGERAALSCCAKPANMLKMRKHRIEKCLLYPSQWRDGEEEEERERKRRRESHR